MLFSSPVFLVAFLPGVLALYYLIPRRFIPARNLLLLAASLGFYAWGEPRFVLVMIELPFRPLDGPHPGEIPCPALGFGRYGGF